MSHQSDYSLFDFVVFVFSTINLSKIFDICL